MWMICFWKKNKNIIKLDHLKIDKQNKITPCIHSFKTGIRFVYNRKWISRNFFSNKCFSFTTFSWSLNYVINWNKFAHKSSPSTQQNGSYSTWHTQSLLLVSSPTIISISISKHILSLLAIYFKVTFSLFVEYFKNWNIFKIHTHSLTHKPKRKYK